MEKKSPASNANGGIVHAEVTVLKLFLILINCITHLGFSLRVIIAKYS